MNVPRLPAHSPDLNPFAERFVLSVRTDSLNKVIPLGERHLQILLKEYAAHYHTERNHQGIENRLISPAPHVGSISGPIKTRRRLGGILSYYYREAA